MTEAIKTGRAVRGRRLAAGHREREEAYATLHFLGLLSDGNVHSHIDHLMALILQAKKEGVKVVRIHALLDGRDVPETSALEYVGPFESFLEEINTEGFDALIASGGGRMRITMDRYEADWPMVERGWKTHVHGEGAKFASATEAVETLSGNAAGLRPEPAAVRDRRERQAGRHHRGRRLGRVLQLPRRPRDRDHAGVRRIPEFKPFDRGRRPKVCSRA